MKYLFLIFSLCAVKFSLAQDALCYTEQLSTSEKGLLGKNEKGIVLYFEAWNVPSANKSNYSAIVLRTDTTRLNDSIDFCLDTEHESDTVFVSISIGDEPHDFATTKVLDVPTLYQVLKVSYGYQQFNNFNQHDSNNKVYLDGDKLFLVYENSLPNRNAAVNTETYKFVDGKYKLISTETKTR